MLWVILVLISAFVYSLVSVIDRIAISKEFRDPLFATFIYGLVAFLAFGGIGFFIDVEVGRWVALASGVLGMLTTLGVYCYYYVLEDAEVSSFAPLLSTFPIFVVIMAYFFLGEVLSTISYAGIGLLILGAILISKNDHKFKIGFNKTFLISLVVMFLIAFVDVVVKYLSEFANIWQILFWGGIGTGVVIIPMFLFHHPTLRKKMIKGTEHLIISNVLTVIGFALAFFAISFGEVSLVTSLGRVTLLFVFAEVYLLSKMFPKVLKERMKKKILIWKLIATVVIIIGAVLAVS